MPAASPVANIFRSVPGPEASETKARNRISAALVTRRPVRPIPRTTAVRVTPVRVVLLAHPGEDEHLVVHREPEQEREHHQRDPGRHRAGGVDAPEQLRPVPVLPDHASTPQAAATLATFRTHRLERQQQRAERPREQDERDERDQGDHQREAPVDGVDEVVVLRRQAAHADVGPAACAVSRTRSSVARAG